jgi:hypothetical protein
VRPPPERPVAPAEEPDVRFCVLRPPPERLDVVEREEPDVVLRALRAEPELDLDAPDFGAFDFAALDLDAVALDAALFDAPAFDAADLAAVVFDPAVFEAAALDPVDFVDPDRDVPPRELFAADADVDLFERPFDDELGPLRERVPADDFELCPFEDPARLVVRRFEDELRRAGADCSWPPSSFSPSSFSPSSLESSFFATPAAALVARPTATPATTFLVSPPLWSFSLSSTSTSSSSFAEASCLQRLSHIRSRETEAAFTSGVPGNERRVEKRRTQWESSAGSCSASWPERSRSCCCRVTTRAGSSSRP